MPQRERTVPVRRFADSNERLMRPNHQGSISIVADRTTATVYGINTYDEYGRPGSGNLGRFQYTGQAWIPELGLYHYKARAYAPKLGRFLQTDPVGYKDDINLYGYVGNDPWNKTDPDGQFALPIGFIIGASLEAGFQALNGELSMDKESIGKVLLAGLAGASGSGLAAGATTRDRCRAKG